MVVLTMLTQKSVSIGSSSRNVSPHEIQVRRGSTSATVETEVVDLFGSWIEDVRQIDILLLAAERRFSATLQEIERHLHGLGQFFREQLDQIIEGSLVTPNAADGEASQTSQAPTGASGQARAHPLPSTNFARRAVDPRGSDRRRSPTRKRMIEGRRSQASR
jgi:hypothetical protein